MTSYSRAHDGLLTEARAHHRARDWAACAGELAAHGPGLLVVGEVEPVAELLTGLPERLLTTELRLLLGDAQRMTGRFAEAFETYRMIDDDQLAVAWRIAVLHYYRGEPAAALDALAAVGISADAASKRAGGDAAMAWAWAAAAHSMRGERVAAHALAERAREVATRAGDRRALATAHTAAGVCSDEPDHTAHHYTLALGHAQAAGDRAQLGRIRNNEVHQLLTEARYPAAAELARAARLLAERGGEAGIAAIACANEGVALARMGRFDEAVVCQERALAWFQQMGSRHVGYALVSLGDLYRWRGESARARAAYEEAIRTNRPGGDLQSLVPAWAGLARVLVPIDPRAARATAREAIDASRGAGAIAAWCAFGWASLAEGDRAAAFDAAARAAATARRLREPAGLAEVAELEAAAASHPQQARASLAEAARIWADASAAPLRDRAVLSIGHLADASADDRLEARLALARLIASGVLIDAGGAGIEVRVLGRFEVRVAGELVPSTAWRSRKARDLLRVLIARRGRPVPRDELAELLWPGDLDAAGHRLSVVLSIVRGVLDPVRASNKRLDNLSARPLRGLPADHYLLASGASVAVDLPRLTVDVETFLTDVAHGLRLRARGTPDLARTVLDDAVRDYLGDPFEDEPYAEWATALREEARAAYTHAVHALAELAVAAGDHHDGARNYLLALARDGYDEAAHRGLVTALLTAGRLGEARRAYARYCDAMREIDVEPIPMPARGLV